MKTLDLSRLFTMKNNFFNNDLCNKLIYGVVFVTRCEVYRLIDIVEEALEVEEIVCSIVLLHVSQALDKVQHEGFIYKLKKILQVRFLSLVESYMTNIMFRMNHEAECSGLKDIPAGVSYPKEARWVRYYIFCSPVFQTLNVVTATFKDETSNTATVKMDDGAALLLQKSNNSVENWKKKWRIKPNEQKAVHVLAGLIL